VCADQRNPANFYTGLVADLYAHLRSETFDPEPFARFIQRSGEPALELGCGDGDPMLALRGQGLDVEGVDSSFDMLERFRRAATERDLEVTLHHTTFQEMDLGRQFRSIYFAGATFNLLPDDDAANESLRRIADHLHASGSALIPLFRPGVPAASDIGKVTEHVSEDGTTMRVTALDIVRDEDARDQFTTLRYEQIRDDEHDVLERTWHLHWYEADQFQTMAADAGLATRSLRGVETAPDTSHATAFSFILGHKDAGQ